jgi:hypothetical protein
MACRVAVEIVFEIMNANYMSLLFDYTPDAANQ